MGTPGGATLRFSGRLCRWHCAVSWRPLREDDNHTSRESRGVVSAVGYQSGKVFVGLHAVVSMRRLTCAVNRSAAIGERQPSTLYGARQGSYRLPNPGSAQRSAPQWRWPWAPLQGGDPGFQLLRTGHLSSVGTCRHPPPITGRSRSGGAENHISISKNNRSRF